MNHNRSHESLITCLFLRVHIQCVHCQEQIEMRLDNLALHRRVCSQKIPNYLYNPEYLPLDVLSKSTGDLGIGETSPPHFNRPFLSCLTASVKTSPRAKPLMKVSLIYMKINP